MAKKPEMQVYFKVKYWAITNGFWLHRVESKSTYSAKAKRYTTVGPAPKGFPDMCGIGPNSESVFIELKAKGKLKTIRPDQHKFLSTAINMGAFAVCIDNTDDLFLYHKTWVELMRSGQKKEAIKYLLSRLPNLPPFEKIKVPLFK